MNIILLYQHISRELYSIERLAEKIEKNGNKAFIYSVDFEMDYAYKTAKRYKIDIVVSPWMYHTKNYEEFVYFIERNPEVIIVNLHSEQIYSMYSKPILLPTEGVASDSVFHFCWGENFKNLLLENGISDKLIRITGNIRNDELFSTKFSKEELAMKYDLDTEKKWILFAENRNFVKDKKISINKEHLCKGITVEKMEEREKIAAKSLEMTVKELNEIGSDFFDEYEFIYRAHPGFQGDMGITNKCIREISELSVYEWLNVSSACIVWNSTTAFESELFNVPVFVYSPIKVPQEYMTVGLDEYCQIDRILNFLKYDFDEVVERQNNVKNYINYYGIVDGKAAERVEEELRTIYNNHEYYRAKVIPRAKNYKSYMALILTRILVRLKLLDIIKIPHSSYLHKSDIPLYVKKARR